MDYCGFFPKIKELDSIIDDTNYVGFNPCIEHMNNESILCIGKQVPNLLQIPLLHRAAIVQCKVIHLLGDKMILITDPHHYLHEQATVPQMTASYKSKNKNKK